MKRNFILLLLVSISTISFLRMDVDVFSNGLMWDNIEALADNGETAICPNGGYLSTGRRVESIEMMWEKFDIGLNAGIGLFEKEGSAEFNIKWNRVMTVAYDCDQSNAKVCAVCNRYKV